MATGAVVAGAGLSIYSQIKSGQAQKEAAENQSALKRAQAQELLKRTEFNIDVLQEKAKVFRQAQVGAFAKSGVSIDSGVSLVQLEQLNADLADEVEIRRDEARFKADALFSDSLSDISLGEDLQTASFLGALGTGLSAFGQGSK